MGVGRIIGTFAAAVLLGPEAPTRAVAPEPLIITKMADPDPAFVPAREASRQPGSGASGSLSEDAQIDQAMENLGRALEEAATIQKRQIEAMCRERVAASATPEQRFAVAASCRYSRH